MKYRISFLLTLLLLLASCQQELPPVAGGGTTGRGHISFNVAPMKSGNTNPLENKDFATKAALGNEDKVNRIDMVFFDASTPTKTYITTYTVSSVNSADFCPILPADVRGKTCNVYFIANLKDAITAPANEAAFKLSNCGLATLSQADVVKYGIPMSGTLLNYTIPTDGIIVNTPITLTRLLARVDIMYTNAVLIATSLQLYNVPAKTPYYSPDTVDPATYYNGIGLSNLDAELNPVSGTTYTYYIPASRRGSDANTDPRLKLGTSAGITDPTYVKILSSSAVYTFYLGGNDCNDYNILANAKYIVNANIKGVSSSDSRIVKLEPESNCYIVKPGSIIKIPVSRAVSGNAAAGYVAAGGTSMFKTGDNFTTGLLWSDVSTTHVIPTAKDNYIIVVAGNTQGNSVIYAESGSVIVWSWHIWVTNYEPGIAPSTVPSSRVSVPNGFLPYHDSKYWMDRNLGATTSTPNAQTTLGLMYQWGRKDPFPPASSAAAGTITGQTILPQPITYPSTGVSTPSSDTNVRFMSFISPTPITAANASRYSIQYPLMFIGEGWSGSTARALPSSPTTVASGQYSWMNSNSKKTVFDPCPSGWRIPCDTGGVAPWSSLGTSDGKYVPGVSLWDSTNLGMNVISPACAVTYYPTPGLRDYSNGSLRLVGSYQSCWSGSLNGDISCYFYSGTGGVQNTSGRRAFGFNVRCVQE